MRTVSDPAPMFAQSFRHAAAAGRAQGYMGRGDYRQAIAVLSTTRSGSPDDALLLELIARCHYASGNDVAAVASAQEALAVDPQSFEAIMVLAEALARQEEHDVASAWARHGLKIRPAPTPLPPQFLVRFFAWIGKLSTRMKRFAHEFQGATTDIDQRRSEWCTWATRYVAWYDSNHNASRPRN